MSTSFSAGLGEIRASPLLTTILLMTPSYGASQEGTDRLWEAHLLDAVQIPALGTLSMA